MKVTKQQLRETIRRIIVENTVSPLIQDAQGALDLLWEEYPNADVMRMAVELIEGLIDEIEDSEDVSTAQELNQMLRTAAEDAVVRYNQRSWTDKEESKFFLEFLQSLESPLNRLKQIR